MFNDSSDSIAFVRSDGLIFDVNQSFCDVGINEESLYDVALLDVVF